MKKIESKEKIKLFSNFIKEELKKRSCQCGRQFG